MEGSIYKKEKGVVYRPGVAKPRPALEIFQAREIHHTKYIYFIMAKEVKTNVLKKYIICAYIQKLTMKKKYFLMISFFFYLIYI